MTDKKPSSPQGKPNHPSAENSIPEPAGTASAPTPPPSNTDPGKESSMKEDIKETAREEGHRVKEVAKEEGRRVKAKAKGMVRERRLGAAEKVRHLESAIDSASAKLREEEEDDFADYTDYLADRCADLSDYIETATPERVMHDVSNQIRRNPVVFFGGLFVAGLAISRFLKASEEEYEEPGPGEEDYYPRQTASTHEPVHAGTPPIV